MLLNSLRNVITSPTRVTNSTSTLIDPIVINQDQSIIKSDVLPVPNDISDHMATLLFLPLTLSSDATYTRRVWNFKRANFTKLNELIANYDWSILYNGNIDDAALLFTNKYIDFVKVCIPYNNVIIRPNDKPWYNSDIRRTSKLRERLRKKSYNIWSP